eukprot:4137760-Amphidinium_carterae.1
MAALHFALPGRHLHLGWHRPIERTLTLDSRAQQACTMDLECGCWRELGSDLFSTSGPQKLGPSSTSTR